MSSYVWMKVLESSPERYDRGIAMLSGGRIEAIYAHIAELAEATPGRRVLDIGCGTGGVALACAARGAVVKGLDISAGMLEVARQRPVPELKGGSVEWIEASVAEIEDHLEPESLDAVVACLSFSELSPDERRYALRASWTCLCPGGRLVIADEALPESGAGRLLYHLRRAPVAAMTYLLTQTTTRPVEGLAELVSKAGFVDLDETRPFGNAFAITTAVRRPEAA